MSSTVSAPTAAVTAAPPHPRRWLTLTLIAIAQLMIVVDSSIVNIGLPSAQ